MLISNIERFPSSRRHDIIRCMIVRIETGAGITGYGEMQDLSHAPYHAGCR